LGEGAYVESEDQNGMIENKRTDDVGCVLGDWAAIVKFEPCTS
jgi:hypothetical protein